ncbi:hypothetical protein [Spongiactinospora sp. TRM90649]|uniref:hypothetical protein n=1 Tax=Spongiactinospora sp. TRM90649 TaxID=3031114 RepID=UPI0023F7DEA3|nr:hypothetical protein [Spongiactinospora sp. TRM90649]MDF5759119.1 hypothetical protein [Spongiactinospora sp. TRM90649]
MKSPDRQAAAFNRTMSQHTREMAPGIFRAHDFARYPVIADLLRAAPRARGVLYDLPAGLGPRRSSATCWPPPASRRSPPAARSRP